MGLLGLFKKTVFFFLFRQVLRLSQGKIVEKSREQNGRRAIVTKEKECFLSEERRKCYDSASPSFQRVYLPS